MPEKRESRRLVRACQAVRYTPRASANAHAQHKCTHLMNHGPSPSSMGMQHWSASRAIQAIAGALECPWRLERASRRLTRWHARRGILAFERRVLAELAKVKLPNVCGRHRKIRWVAESCRQQHMHIAHASCRTRCTHASVKSASWRSASSNVEPESTALLKSVPRKDEPLKNARSMIPFVKSAPSNLAPGAYTCKPRRMLVSEHGCLRDIGTRLGQLSLLKVGL